MQPYLGKSNNTLGIICPYAQVTIISTSSFNKSTIDIFNQIRGLNPWPGAYATLDGVVVKIYNSRISESFFTTKKNGEIGKIYSDGIGVSTSDGEIIITELQFAGKRKMTVKEYLNGVNPDNLIGKVFNGD